MNDPVFDQHLQRLKLQTTEKLKRKDLGDWVVNNTYLNGRKFSTKGHEYQARIMEDESPEIVIKKSAQIGISEMSLRMTLGLVSIMPSFSSIYTMPTATLAGVYTKTRLDPIIEGSPYLREAVQGDLNSAEVKQLGPNNFMYMKGAASGNAAISVSADLLVHDELSFSDTEVIAAYSSRLIHSPYKWRIKLSTPTYPGDPIDKAFQASRRHFNMAHCDHCAHYWLPNYYQDVKIPGFDGDLKTITKNNLHALRYEEAKLLCPNCGKEPDLSPVNREWVVENNTERHVASGYGLSPFDCPTFITPASLVLASTQYDSRSLFENFHLGICAEDADTGLIAADLDAAGIEMDQSPFMTHVIGSDMGLLCRLMVGGVGRDGQIIVVHTEQVPIAKFRARYAELARKYRVTAKVLDEQPYTETILNLQQGDPNLFSGVFVSRKGLALYEVHTREENEREGKLAIRRISINKSALLDVILEEIRSGQILIRKDENWEDVKTQCTSMKRIRQLTDDGVQYVWRKPTDGDDHFHMALAYLYLAVQVRGVVSGGAGLNMGIGTFKHKAAVAGTRAGTGMA